MLRDSPLSIQSADDTGSFRLGSLKQRYIMMEFHGQGPRHNNRSKEAGRITLALDLDPGFLKLNM
jgi:hypothetical protein